MFRSARIKLMSWYLAIIMAITLAFSSVVYFSVAQATERALEAQRRRVEIQVRRIYPPVNLDAPRELPNFNIETLHEIRERTLVILGLVNIVVLVISGGVGYFLAGKTLKPIEEMLNKQKRFISDAAHELKTPLTAMKTDLEVTLRDKNFNPQKAKIAISDTIEEIDNLHKFVNKLLQQSKYQNGVGNGAGLEAFDTVNCQKILQNVVKKLDKIAKQNGGSINLNTKSIKICGNEDELETLFTNIIENAVKYNRESQRVEVVGNVKNQSAVFTIKDFGAGINKKDLPHIFEPFYRADKSRTKLHKDGYGLGLAISKEIVEKYKGTITAESEINEGTTFIITLPLSQ